MHGRISAVHHDGSRPVRGHPAPFEVVRYHSLCVSSRCPPGSSARVDRGRRADGRAPPHAPLWGVQFHPESICTEHGRGCCATSATSRALAAAARTARPPGAVATTQPPRACDRQPRTRFRCASSGSTRSSTEGAFAQLYAERERRLLARQQHSVDGRVALLLHGRRPRPARRAAHLRRRERRRAVTRDGDAETRRTSRSSPTSTTQIRARRATTSGDLPFDFNGGYVGYLGYELKAECGGDAAHASDAPDAAFVFADRFSRSTTSSGPRTCSSRSSATRATPSRTADRWLATRAAAGRAAAARRPARRRRRAPRRRAAPTRRVRVRLRHDRDDAYLERIARCQRELTDGETYEVCLTNRSTADARSTRWRLRRLRRVNPAPYAAFLRFGEVAVLSASPERFLSSAATAASRRSRSREPRRAARRRPRTCGSRERAARQREGPRREPDDRRPAAQRPRRVCEVGTRARAGPVARRDVRDGPPAGLDDPRRAARGLGRSTASAPCSPAAR